MSCHILYCFLSFISVRPFLALLERNLIEIQQQLCLQAICSRSLTDYSYFIFGSCCFFFLSASIVCDNLNAAGSWGPGHCSTNPESQDSLLWRIYNGWSLLLLLSTTTEAISAISIIWSFGKPTGLRLSQSGQSRTRRNGVSYGPPQGWHVGSRQGRKNPLRLNIKTNEIF